MSCPLKSECLGTKFKRMTVVAQENIKAVLHWQNTSEWPGNLPNKWENHGVQGSELEGGWYGEKLRNF